MKHLAPRLSQLRSGAHAFNYSYKNKVKILLRRACNQLLCMCCFQVREREIAIDRVFHTHLLLAVLVLEVAASVTLSGEERILACPREPDHYTCISSRVNSITWSFLCQDQLPPAFTFSVGVSNIHDQFSCTSANGGMVSYDLTLTYASNDSTTESNISITVLEIADTVTHLNSLRISCESQDSYKYLDVTGKDEIDIFRYTPWQGYLG